MSPGRARVVIVGAGPAGATTSLFLSRLSVPHVLLDSTRFPRDKPCGDGLTWKVVTTLQELDPALLDALMDNREEVQPIEECRFFSPGGHPVTLRSCPSDRVTRGPIGCTVSRRYFDAFLLSKLDRSAADVRLGWRVTDVRRGERGLVLQAAHDGTCDELEAELVICADGAQSSLARKLTGAPPRRRSCGLGMRRIYENVGATEGPRAFEFHFLAGRAPAYVWFFPMAGGRANVGVAQLARRRRSNEERLDARFAGLLARHPALASRLAGARPVGEIGVGTLPMDYTARAVHGDRFMLVGDAAGLIDPFTFEGIGNAMWSARVAAGTAAEALRGGRCAASDLAGYRARLDEELEGELAVNRMLGRIVAMPVLFDVAARRVSRREHLRELFDGMLTNPEARRRFADPRFLFRLFFR